MPLYGAGIDVVDKTSLFIRLYLHSQLMYLLRINTPDGLQALQLNHYTIVIHIYYIFKF